MMVMPSMFLAAGGNAGKREAVRRGAPGIAECTTITWIVSTLSCPMT